jgi:hypothetical protein
MIHIVVIACSDAEQLWVPTFDGLTRNLPNFCDNSRLHDNLSADEQVLVCRPAYPPGFTRNLDELSITKYASYRSQAFSVLR